MKLPAIRPHVAWAGLTALLFGLGEGLVAARAGGASRWIAGAIGAGLAAHVGLVIGLAQAGAFALVGWAARRVGLAEAFRQATSDDVSAPREPVVALHCTIGGVLAATGVGLGLVWVVLGPILNIAELQLVRTVTVVAVAGIGLVSFLTGAIVARALRGPVTRIDRRFTLPRPRLPVLRYLCFVVIPVGGAVAATLVYLGETLGTLAEPVWLVALLVAEGTLFFGWSTFIRARALPRTALVMAIAATVAGTALAFQLHPPVSRASPGVIAGRAMSLLRWLSDVDRDGVSSLYGGGDCAALDASIYPGAHDEPGNGADEDCDGADTTIEAGTFPKLRTFLGGLEAHGLPPRAYNIVWVIVDAVRADKCSLYGHERKTTPFLEEIAAESLVFENAYSQSSLTKLSMPSMFTGRTPGRMQWRGRSTDMAEANVTIAERLAEAGYRTGLVGTGYLPWRMPSVRQGYADFEDIWLDGNRNPWSARQSPIATTLAIRILEKQRDSTAPFFLTVYSGDPHHPYEAHVEQFPKFARGQIGRYEGEIAFADRYTGMFVDYLRSTRVWDNTIFVFSSDHGEEFREHGGKKHARTCYEESTHVPLLVRIPGLEGRRVDTRVAMVDVVPTLLGFVGLDAGAMTLEGQSLLIPAMDSRAVSPDRAVFCTVLSQGAADKPFFRQSVRVGAQALMLERISQSYELYDLAADPGEQNARTFASGHDDDVSALSALLDAELTGNIAGRMRSAPVQEVSEEVSEEASDAP